MFERYTDEARRVIERARLEAMLSREIVGSPSEEDLIAVITPAAFLIAVLETSAAGQEILQRTGMTIDDVRRYWSASPLPESRFSSELKRVLLTIDKTGAANQPVTGVELLNGLLTDPTVGEWLQTRKLWAATKG